MHHGDRVHSIGNMVNNIIITLHNNFYGQLLDLTLVATSEGIGDTEKIHWQIIIFNNCHFVK